MFNGNGYSLADVAAATRGGEDGFFGGNSGWWIILLFMFCGWGNGGWGGNRTGTENVRDAVAYGFFNIILNIYIIFNDYFFIFRNLKS